MKTFEVAQRSTLYAPNFPTLLNEWIANECYQLEDRRHPIHVIFLDAWQYSANIDDANHFSPS